MENLKFVEFIKGLELKNIILKGLHVDLRYPEFPGNMKIDYHVDTNISTETEKDFATLNAKVVMLLKFINAINRRVHARIMITLNLEYVTLVKPDDEMIEFFEKSSLMLNAWPYLRFWVQTITQSFGWPPFVIPLFKNLPDEVSEY